MSRTVKVILFIVLALLAIAGSGIAVGAYVIVAHFQGIQIAHQGYQALAAGKDDAAISLFSAALKKPLGDYHRSYVLLNRATAYNHKHRYDESIRDNTAVLRLNRKLTFAYELRAWAHHQKGEIEEEFEDLNEALRIPSSSGYAYQSRGLISYNRKEFDRALADFNEAVRCDPNQLDPLIMRARCYLAKDDLDGALASFDAAISMAPENASLYQERANVYRRKGDQGKSSQDLAQARQLNRNTRPTNDSNDFASDNWNQLHLSMLQQHAALDAREFDRAIDIINKAIATKPGDEWMSQFVMDRGNAYSGKGDTRRALSDYDEAIGLNPKNAGAYVNRGRVLGRSGRYSEALKDYEAALRINPKQWEAYYNRAVDLHESGKTSEALADLDQVTLLNPNFVGAYLSRASIHMRRHELDQAIRDCDAAASVAPMSPQAYAARARIHEYRKDYVAAVHDLEAAAGVEKAHPESSLNSLAWLWATAPDSQVRDGEKAVTAATKACELTKWLESAYVDTLAAAYAQAGQFEEAVKCQKKAIDITPKENKSVRGMRDRLALYKQHKPYREQTPN